MGKARPPVARVDENSPEQGDGFGAGLKAAIILATLLLAASIPARYIIAWREPAYASLVGLPWLRTLPQPTIIVATVTATAQSVLMAFVVREIWKIADSFHRGEFFSRSVTKAMRRASYILFGVGAAGTLGVVIGLTSLSIIVRDLPPLGLGVALLNLPAGAFVCGLMAYVIAGAFDRAIRMADEARFMV